MPTREEIKRQKAERIREAPYRFWMRKADMTSVSRNFKTREEALTAIRQLQKKGFRICKFHNLWTGKSLKVPEGPEPSKARTWMQ